MTKKSDSLKGIQGVSPYQLQEIPTRESIQTREEINPFFDMSYHSPLDIPSRVKKDGFSYVWARRSKLYEHDFRIEALSRRGWTPVPSERWPDCSLDPLGTNEMSRKFVCTKDLILMERPAEFSKRELEYQQKSHNEILASIKKTVNIHDDTFLTQTRVQSF